MQSDQTFMPNTKPTEDQLRRITRQGRLRKSLARMAYATPEMAAFMDPTGILRADGLLEVQSP